MNIVSTQIPYTYSLLQQNLFLLNNFYNFLNVQIIGNSVLGKKLYVVKLGTGPRNVFYSSSIHANEYITSMVLMKFIEDYCNAYVTNSDLEGVYIKDLFNTTTIYIMPMVNPDGIDLVNGVYSRFSAPYLKARAIANNYATIPFPNGWKANINGVDLKNLQPFCKIL